MYVNNNTWQAKIKFLINNLYNSAIVRDLKGGHPHDEIKLIHDLGILNLLIEKDLGGEGLSWSKLLKIIQEIAMVDSSIAHIYAFHFLQLISIKIYGSKEQYNHYAKLTVKDNLFWANALNPNDNRLLVKYTNSSSQFIINGTKSYCSGSLGSDYLLISALDSLDNLYILVSPSNRSGIFIKDDWDSFGQRQTDSGSVLFNNVIIEEKEILLRSPKGVIDVNKSIRTLLAQSILISLYIGIGKGSLIECKKYLNGKKSWFKSNSKLLIDDDYIQHKFAKSHLLIRSSEVLFNLSLIKIDKLIKKLGFITEKERGDLSISLIESKAMAHKACLRSTSDIFEILGASSVSRRLSLDRFWRNARVHTLHDPIDYKLKDLGNYLLTGDYPVPSYYS